MASKSRGTMLTCTLQALTTRMTSSASVPSACTGATTTRSTSSGSSWLRTFVDDVAEARGAEPGLGVGHLHVTDEHGLGRPGVGELVGEPARGLRVADEDAALGGQQRLGDQAGDEAATDQADDRGRPQRDDAHGASVGAEDRTVDDREHERERRAQAEELRRLVERGAVQDGLVAVVEAGDLRADDGQRHEDRRAEQEALGIGRQAEQHEQDRADVRAEQQPAREAGAGTRQPCSERAHVRGRGRQPPDFGAADIGKGLRGRVLLSGHRGHP